MSREKLAKVGRSYGRDLAERIIDRARREGLTSTEIAVLFAEDVARHTRDMDVRGVSGEQIADWVAGVAQGYSERIDQQTSEQRL